MKKQNSTIRGLAKGLGSGQQTQLGEVSSPFAKAMLSAACSGRLSANDVSDVSDVIVGSDGGNTDVIVGTTGYGGDGVSFFCVSRRLVG